jgi:hypothetical protein
MKKKKKNAPSATHTPPIEKGHNITWKNDIFGC